MYLVDNNAETQLIQSLSYNGTYLVVADTSLFPLSGLITVGKEVIYYGSKTGGSFSNLIRGFAGSQQSVWPNGTTVSGSVMAEIHNAKKDAIINIQSNVGLNFNPAPTSLNGILQSLETRFLAPKAIFRASPTRGPSPLTVTFQNFSTGSPVRFLWNFGDGGTSVESAPTHTYLAEGSYTVQMTMITSLGAQGITTKTNYITVNNSLAEGFYYVTPTVGTTSTAFTFVDQTVGNIVSRYWIFDDGNTIQQLDPDIHTVTHTYSSPGTYNTAEIVVFADQTSVRYTIDSIMVS